MIRNLAVLTVALFGLLSLFAPLSTAQSLQRFTLQHDGIEREYFVYVPTAAEEGKPLPVVLGLHGYYSTATGFAAYHGLNHHAEAAGYYAVYPQGSQFVVGSGEEAWRITSWNELTANKSNSAKPPHCTADHVKYPCPPECDDCGECGWVSCYDDVGFLGRVLNQVEAQFNTDVRRYYLLGVSTGGMMAFRVGCDLSERFAAVAPINGQLAPGYACGPSTDLPMIHLAGGLDNTIRPDGKPGGDGYIYTSAEVSAAVWAENMQCDTGPAPWNNNLAQRAGLNCTAYTDCRVAGQEVVSCVLPEGDHNWPGQRVADMPATCVTPEQQASMPGRAHCPPAGDDYTHWGMDLVWAFFSRYQR